MGKRGKKVSPNSVLIKVPTGVKSKMREKGIFVRTVRVKIRYAVCNQGYDLLENMFVVRHYISDKYNVTLRVLELLLKLYPMNYFTYEDYYELPKNFQLVRADYLKEKKLIEEYKHGTTRVNSVFCLTRKGKNCVEDFYKYLSGEKKIPETTDKNKMGKKNATQIDKLRFNFIKKMNQEGPSESKKKLFE